MKAYIIVLLLFVFTFTCNAQNLNGSWKGVMNTPNGDMELTFTFKVNADSLSGNVTSQMGTLPLENGKVEGAKFSFDVDVNGQVIHHTGVLDSNKVKLTLPFGDQQMVLNRVVEKSKINGTWVGKVSGPQGETELTFTFKVDGDTLTGKDSSTMGDIDLTNGIVKGNDFSFDVELNGMKISHKCKYLDDDTIDVNADIMDQKVNMKLTRVKQ